MTDISHQLTKHCTLDIKRSKRVIWLLVSVVIMSLFDLILTLSYLTTVGMSESNPVAVWILQATNSIWALVFYKVFTVSICVTLLYRTRHRSQSEIAAWCAMLILLTLSIWWNQYSRYQPLLPMGENHIMLLGDTFEQPFASTRDQRSLVQ